MSIAATTVFECRAAGSDNSGGGFVAGGGGTDRTLSDTAFANGTNLTVDATTNTDVAPDGYTCVSADVGNLIQITTTGGGAAFTVGFYEIKSIQSSKWRLDRSPAATSSAGATWAMGGALASPGKSAGAMAAGNDLYIKAGTYTVTSATPNVAAGCLTIPAAASNNNACKVYGYQTTRGDGGTKPIIIADGVITTFVLITAPAMTHIENLELNGNSRTSSRGIACTAAVVENCTGRNFTNSFIVGTHTTLAIRCYATTCSTQVVFNACSVAFCVAAANTVTAFAPTNGGSAAFCYAVNNTGASSDGFTVQGQAWLVGCVAYGNGRHGFMGAANTNHETLINCIAYGHAGGYGFNSNTNPHDGMWLYTCAGGSNSSGNVNTTNVPAANTIGFIALSADPFTNAGSLDFSLNSTAGGGAAIRQLAYPALFLGLSTNNYGDVGAAQAVAAAAGGLLVHGGMTGGMRG